MNAADVELFAQHLLGALEGDEERSVAARLDRPTPDDLAALGEARRLVACLGLAEAPVAPPAAARDRLLARVAAEPRSLGGPSAEPLPSAPPLFGSRGAPPGARRPVRWLAPALIAAVFLVLAGLQTYSVLYPPMTPASQDEAQVLALLSDPAAERWTFRDTSAEKKPVALALQDAGRRRLLVFAKKLPTIEKGQTYVLWYLRPGATGATPENVGAFQVRKGLQPDVVLDDATPMRELAGLAVSVETDPRTKTPTSVQALASP